MDDHALEIENPLAQEPKEHDMRRLTNDVLEMEYPVVEEHIVEFHEIFEDGQANREENNNDRRLYCKYCGKNFKSYNYVKMHERWHRGELSHHCPECNRAFRYPSELRKHTTIHTGQLPYKCEECDLRFNKAQAAHEHRLRDHVGMIENAAQDSKPLQPPIVFQMNNNYQPMSFEVVLPNLHTQTQMERGNDPLMEGFSADSYARPSPMLRSSVIRPNYSCSKEPNYPNGQEINYSCSKEPNYPNRQEINYSCSEESNYPNGQEINYSCSEEPNYAGKQDETETARLEEATMWRESSRWEEEMQFGRNYGINAATWMDNMDDVDVAKDYGSHVHIQKPNLEECRKCRQIMEYENEIAQLRNHHCTH